MSAYAMMSQSSAKLICLLCYAASANLIQPPWHERARATHSPTWRGDQFASDPRSWCHDSATCTEAPTTQPYRLSGVGEESTVMGSLGSTSHSDTCLGATLRMGG